MKNIKKWFILLAIALILTPSDLWGRVQIERAMREFQARYHQVINTNSFYTWPDCGNGPAPAYPKDGFYGDIIEKPDLGVILVSALRTAFLDSGVYSKFVTTGDLEGKTNVTFYRGSDFNFATVNKENYTIVFEAIRKAINDLQYVGVHMVASEMYRKDSEVEYSNQPNCMFSTAKSEALTAFNTNSWCFLWAGNEHIGMGTHTEHIHSVPGDPCTCIAVCNAVCGTVTVDLRYYLDGMADIYYMTDPSPTGPNSVPSGLLANGTYHLATTVPTGGIYQREFENEDISIPSELGSWGWYMQGGFAIVKMNFDTTPDDVDCCPFYATSCSFGGLSSSVSGGGMSVVMNMGRTAEGKRPAHLTCKERVPNENTYSLSGLQLFVSTNYAALDVTEGVINNIPYIDVPQGRVLKLASPSQKKYDLFFCPPGATGTNTFFKKISVGVFNYDTNQIQVVETVGTNSRSHLFTYNTTNSTWTLARGETGQVKFSSSSTWNGTNKVHTLKSMDGDTLVSQTVETKALYPWGLELISRTRGSTNDMPPLTETWTYHTSTNATDTNNFGHLATYTDENGHWERYEYDSAGRITNLVEQIASADISTTDAANKVTSTLYSSTPPHITEIVKWRNAEVSRKYTSWCVDSSNGTGFIEYVTNIVCQTPGAGVSDSNNLVTVIRYNTLLYWDDFQFPLKPQYVLYPNGTVDLFEYELDHDQAVNRRYVFKETLKHGVATNLPGGEIGILNNNGTCTVSIRNAFGQSITNTVTDLSSGIKLSSQINEFDTLGRVCKTTYLDGTSTTRSNVYCGVKWEKSREGVVTYYDYDNMRRLVKTTVNNVCTTNILDADGNVLVSMRFPTNNYAGRLTNFMASYDTAGRMTFETNAVGTVTAYDRYLSGSLCYEDAIEGYGSTSTITNQTRYYKDGTPYDVRRNGVQHTIYAYGYTMPGTNSFGVNHNERFTTINRPSGYGTVWERTFFDMVGRSHKTVLPGTAVFTEDFYNSKGQRIRSRDADGNQMLYQYNGLGELEYTAVDMDGDGSIGFGGTDRITRQVRSVTTAHGAHVVRQETYRWATNGVNSSTKVSTLDTSTDGLASWQMLWNGSASVTNKTVTEYPATGAITRRVTVTKPDGTRTVSEYESGRLARVMEKGINSAILTQTSYGYDDYGRQNTITDSRNGTTTLTFDAAGRVVTVTAPPPGAGQNAQVTTHYYDALGRDAVLKYPDNTYLTNVYNSDGFLILTKGSRQYPVGYSYDLQGRLRYMTNWTTYPGTYQLTTWDYSPSRGYLVSKYFSNANSSNYIDRVDYTYTSGGKVATRQWARTGPGSSRITTTYSYNKAGEPYIVTYSDGTAALTNTYNRLGQLTGVANNGIATTLSYNGAGQLTSESYAGGTLGGLSVSKTYDAKLRLSQVRAPNLVTNAFAYSGTSGRLATVTHGAYSANYGYTTNSPLVSQVLFKQGSDTQMTTTKSYDKLNRLTRMVSTPSGGGQLPFAYGASYNEANQRTSVTNNGTYWAYEYNTQGEISSAKKHFADGTFVPGQQFTYSYDHIGNRSTTRAGGDQNGSLSGDGYAYYVDSFLNQYTTRYRPYPVHVTGAADPDETVYVNGAQVAYRNGEFFWKELSYVSTLATWFKIEVATSGGDTNVGHVFLPSRPEYFTYDLDGNMVTSGRWNYTWDAENRLTSMTVNTNVGPQLQLDFQYDWMGRRISKTVKTNGVTSYSRKFLYDGWNLIAELDGNNSLVRSYTWGLDASGSMQGAGGVGGLLMVNAGTNGVHFPAYDLNGNVMGLVNAANGNISAKYEYGPFGEVFCSVGDMAKLNPFGFSTKYADNETDFVYYGYRYYSPSLGRWLSRDPIEEQGGLNLYGFVNNDPVNKWDKLGEAWSTTGEAIWTALGYIVPGSEFPSAAMCAPDAARLLIMNKFNAACKRCLIDPPDGDDSSCDKICAEAERVKSVLQRR